MKRILFFLALPFLICCDSDKGSFVLINNADNDEEVRFSLDGIVDNSSIADTNKLQPGQCITVSGADLDSLVVLAGVGGNLGTYDYEHPLAGKMEVLCGAHAYYDKNCRPGYYEIVDISPLLDYYVLRPLKAPPANVQCPQVRKRG